MSFRFIAVLIVCPLYFSEPSIAFSDTKSKESKVEDHLSLTESLHSCQKSKSKVLVSFPPGAKLEDLVSWAMSFTCKNFVYSSGLTLRSSKVEIVAPTKLGAKQAWQLFHIALQSIGLTVVPKGPLWQIIEINKANKQALAIRNSSGHGQALERLIVQPEHISVSEAAEALRALSSSQGLIVPLPSANALLVTDLGSHTQRMAELLRHVDRPAPNEGLYAIHLQFADVTEVSKQLASLLEPRAGQSTPTKKRQRSKVASNTSAPSLLVSDQRSNTLLLRSSEATYQRALQITKELDRKLASDSSVGMHFYPLQYADGVKLAASLTSLTQAGAANTNSPPRIEKTVSKSLNASIQGEMQIAVDEETNSLLIKSTMRDFMSIKTVITKLDRKRPQVFLEVTILEVALDDTRDLSGSFHLGKKSGANLLLGGVQNEGTKTTSITGLGSSLSNTGLIAGIVGTIPSDKFLGISIPSAALLLRAIATNKRIDILSEPQIMTMNNTEAELSVGETISIKKSSTQSGNSALGIIDRYEPQEINMVLKVTPHVNHKKMVRLEVELVIKELLPREKQEGVSWSNRKVVNTVVVEDQESIIIASLASSKETNVDTKVPLLGDIPIIGHLFKSSGTEKKKRNLVVLITPYVLSGSAEARRLTSLKLAERQEFLRSLKDLKSVPFRKNIDYRKKRGLLAEIGAQVQSENEKKRLLEEIDSEVLDVNDGAL